jgi:KipI family sensor histidine kinase inhibitor
MEHAHVKIHPDTPAVQPVGQDGMVVRFGDALSDDANCAALAFRAAVDAEGWEGVLESSTSLVSVFLRFDPLHLPHAELQARLAGLLATQRWSQADLPRGRRRHTIPTVYGWAHGPQLAEAADLAGLSLDQAVCQLSETIVRVQTIGFAPGLPYLGSLPEVWDIPRQTGLTPQVPAGALVVALRQFVLFSVSSPTGWRWIGQTAAPLFQPEASDPVLLRPGDEVRFARVEAEAFARMQVDPSGGVQSEQIL